jgi:hypothetical protein
MLTASENVTDFKYFALGHSLENETIDYYEADIILETNRLDANEPFITNWQSVGDAIDYRGISYVDASGEAHRFRITQSGKDGSVLLIEF